MKLTQKPILTEKEISSNRRAMDHAIAQQTLEGLAVSRETINDLERAVRGEITTADAIRNVHTRLDNAKILK